MIPGRHAVNSRCRPLGFPSPGESRASVDLPDRVQTFICRFDGRYQVDLMTFEIDYPPTTGR